MTTEFTEELQESLIKCRQLQISASEEGDLNRLNSLLKHELELLDRLKNECQT